MVRKPVPPKLPPYRVREIVDEPRPEPVGEQADLAREPTDFEWQETWQRWLERERENESTTPGPPEP